MNGLKGIADILVKFCSILTCLGRIGMTSASVGSKRFGVCASPPGEQRMMGTRHWGGSVFPARESFQLKLSR